MNLIRYFLLLSVLTAFNFQIFAQNSDLVEKNKTPAPQPQKKHDYCISFNDSYLKNVVKGRKLIEEGKEKQGIEFLKRHLKCWDDKEVYVELAALYEVQKKYYLAGLTFKEAGMIENFNKVEKKRISISTLENLTDYDYYVKKESSKFQKRYTNKKAGSVALFILSGIATGTGLGFFISDKGLGKQNSLSAQYTLLLGGLSLAGAGIALSASSQYDKNIAKTYLSIKNFCDIGTTPQEYYTSSGLESQTRKFSAKTFKTHGAALITLALPLFAVSIYSFFDSYDYIVESVESDSNCENLCFDGLFIFLETFSVHLFQIITLAPAIASLTGGIIMLVKASKWEKLDAKESIFTLNSITPVIDPVSKTYGLSMGFSF